MSFTVRHSYYDRALTVRIRTEEGPEEEDPDDEEAGFETAHTSLSDKLLIRFPGKLIISYWAYGLKGTYVDGRWNESHLDLSLALEIWTPDGQPFTADRVTLDDLRRYRDLRGTSLGNWTFRLRGETPSTPFLRHRRPKTGDGRLLPGKGWIRIAVDEHLASQSAPPLVADRLMPGDTRRYSFDLFRVGNLAARAVSKLGTSDERTRRQLMLHDPDGAVVASGGGALDFPVTLRTLDQSRDADGNPRLWSLEVGEEVGGLPSSDVDVSATVVAEARISTAVLNDRIRFLIGEHSEKISIYGEMQGTDLLARLKILDEVSAETVDMLGVLDSFVEDASLRQDEGVTKDVAVDVPYILAREDGVLWKIDKPELELRLSLHDIKVTPIYVGVGNSHDLKPTIPAVLVQLRVEGHVNIEVGEFTLATARIRDNSIRVEAGLRVRTDGSFARPVWIEEDRLDIDLHWELAVASEVATALFGLYLIAAPTEAAMIEWLEGLLNAVIQHRLKGVLVRTLSHAPQILAVLHGDVFTYRDVRMAGDDIVFDYVAPVEPDPKPSSGYIGVIGRKVMAVGPSVPVLDPPTLGNTWNAQNLLNKIEHVVVVMMENRSFDHVLGYRAQLPGLEDSSDGLTLKLLKFLNSREVEGFTHGSGGRTHPCQPGVLVPRLKDSDIPLNSVLKRTAFPRGVGHSSDAVAQQLDREARLLTPAGRSINGMKGFLDNFAPRANGLCVEDVLGYYDAADLPFFGFLAENYAYCEKYFCSHPGPTIPNRMFGLCGDLQYDRTGEAIIDNNKGDNFQLSRALNIFDLLQRKGIAWRVYESFPSLAMLRMFARYAGDYPNIVSLAKGDNPVWALQQDVASGHFPSVVFIDPAFTHHPQNDDHPENPLERPVVDMWRGQQFLKSIYDTLRSNDELWRKTLLIITYDEHGGFYDHVIPPVADMLYQPSVMGRGGMGTATSSMMINYGVRVPTFVVSPWVPAGKGPDIVLDHCSIVKTIMARFLGTRRHRLHEVYYTYPFLSDRVHASRSFDAYLSAAEPRMDVPASPVLQALETGVSPRSRTIITDVLSRAQMRRGNVTFHDLIGRLARLLGR